MGKQVLFKDNLRHVENFKSSLAQTWIQIGWHQTGSGEECSTSRRWGKDSDREEKEVKKRAYLIGYSISGCLTWESPVGFL